MVYFWSIIAIVVMVIAPIVIVWSAVDFFRTKGQDRRGSGGISAGVGAAMMELDRIFTRPSIEHQIETENQVLRREDDNGDGDDP
jgi:hypothetical protein